MWVLFYSYVCPSEVLMKEGMSKYGIMENKKQKIYFIGIGGIGVSALARYFLARGDSVSGSDAVGSGITEELGKMGAEIFIGHKIENITQSDCVMFSAAVREDNPELIEARRLGIKTQKYAEALGELTKEKFTIAVSGMHGKSTTTAMIGLIMEKAGLDPTVIVGTKVRWGNQESGIRNQESGKNLNLLNPPLEGGQNPPQPSLKGGRRIDPPPLGGVGVRGDFDNASNFRMGRSKYLVIEADEYDKSILNYWPKILVLLNIEEEHLDTYRGGLPEIMETFKEYVEHLPEDGVLVANHGDANISKLILDAVPTPTVFPSLREGESKRGRDWRVVNFGAEKAGGLNLKIPGKHNLSNANAALTVARVLSIDEEIAIEALNNFIGAWRRMEYKGKLNGAKIYDDYGHHPTEIKATLAGACELLAISHKPLAKLWCVFQPHQYQRTYNLFDQFVSAFGAADKIILLPIYSVAGREDEGIKNKVNSEMLAEKIRNQEAGSKNQEILYLSDFDKVAEYLRKNLQAGDVCVIMGA